MERDAGARGLRSIVEKIMMEIMFTIPSRKDIEEVVITPGVIERNDTPVFCTKKRSKAYKAFSQKKASLEFSILFLCK